MVALLIATPLAGAAEWELTSPAGSLQVRVTQSDNLQYAVSLRGQEIIAPSTINLKVEGTGPISAGQPQVDRRSVKETIEFVVARKYRERDVAYEELKLTFAHGAVVFRAYDEAIAYRWETSLPGEIVVTNEQAEFVFPGDPEAWFPEEESVNSHQERVYKHLKLGEISSDRFCSTGVLIGLGENRKVYISESDLRSYPGMFLHGLGNGKIGLAGKFAGYALESNALNDRDVPVTKAAEYLAKTEGTRTFPWRVMLVTEKDSELLESEIIFQLAPPLAIEDPSWIVPGKAAWEWWNSINITGVDFRAGVNTESYKYYIDFAAEHGLKYIVLDEGWSQATNDLLTPHADVNLPELVEYGKQKGVGVVLWVVWKTLDEQLEPALDYFQKLGVAGIKVDFMQRDDQQMVEFYHRVAAAAAKRRLLVDFHGAFKPTGLHRAYPNVMSYEGVTGLEQYKWGNEITNPEQELTLPFIRMVAGPMDYTPGALSNANQESWRWNVGHPMSLGTRCHQLAMFVVYESPLQMLADSPSRYRQEADAMRFLSVVPTVWDDTRVLDAKVSDYVVVARRSGDAWFLGAMTDWSPRELEVGLDFLPAGKFRLESWADGANADRSGEDVRCDSRDVDSQSTLKLRLAPAGGWIGIIRPLDGSHAPEADVAK
ncbi:glycoside hydrolase family 97 protein [Lacipirellula parvula]|uniref:glycoside hydrolase family 97 protein n=1 Tax=Lacipirellula parvula TaxID=2650471 RepID=UPI0015620DD6|nr:glycoside hydrolase family 97 protein [Lacipirellula parvula]